jgi:serine/threonine protein phosphatase PrpC
VISTVCHVRVACVGDSELVIAVDGVAQLRSFKHKPTVPSERQRIQSAGGGCWLRMCEHLI